MGGLDHVVALREGTGTQTDDSLSPNLTTDMLLN